MARQMASWRNENGTPHVMRGRPEGGVSGGEGPVGRVSGRGGFAALATGDSTHHERADEAQGVCRRLGDDDDAVAEAGISAQIEPCRFECFDTSSAGISYTGTTCSCGWRPGRAARIVSVVPIEYRVSIQIAGFDDEPVSRSCGERQRSAVVEPVNVDCVDHESRGRIRGVERSELFRRIEVRRRLQSDRMPCSPS